MGIRMKFRELDEAALKDSARRNNTTVEAVVLAIKTYDDIAVEMPDVRPSPEMGRRLEVDGDWAIGLMSDYIMYGLEHWPRTT